MRSVEVLPLARPGSAQGGKCLDCLDGLTIAFATLMLAVLLAPWPVEAGPVGPQDATRLERLVLHDCGSCHGLTRRGGLGPDIRAEALSHYEPEGLAAVILDGIPGTAMPPWRPLLSEDEARWIAQYLLEDGG